MDIGSPAGPIDTQGDHEVAGRDERRGLVGPFDQPDAITIEMFVQACIEKLLRVRQSIKIKVIQV